jgi:hypothetical protein
MRSYLALELIAAIYVCVAMLAGVEGKTPGAILFTIVAGYYLIRALLKYEKEKPNVKKTTDRLGAGINTGSVRMRDRFLRTREHGDISLG